MADMTSKTFGEFVKTATRPVLTIIGLLAWVMFIEGGVDYPTEFKILVVAMVGEWFGERFLTRFGEMTKKQ